MKEEAVPQAEEEETEDMIGGDEQKEEEDEKEDEKEEEAPKKTGVLGMFKKKPKKPLKEKKDDGAEDIMEFAKQLSALNVMHFTKKIERAETGIAVNPKDIKNYEFAMKLYSDPVLLKYATTILLAIKFKALGKQVVTSIIVKFVQYISDKSNVDPLVMKSFTNIIDVFAGRPSDELESTKKDAKLFSFVEKVEKLITIVTDLFLPDLKSAQGLFRKLVNVVVALLNVKSLSEFAEVLATIASEVGDLFNADPIIVNGLVGILRGDYEALA